MKDLLERLDDQPEWLRIYCTGHLEADTLYNRAVAMGAFCRFREMSRERRQAVCDSLLAGKFDREFSLPWDWYIALPSEDKGRLRQDMVAECHMLMEQVERVEFLLTQEDRPLWGQALRALLKRRDDLESLRVLMQLKGDPVLKVLDDMALEHVVGWPVTEEAAKDETLKQTASDFVGESWWGIPTRRFFYEEENSNG